MVFQQNNAPVHQSEVVRNFQAQKQREALNWPAYSPDLNPIEKIRAILKKACEVRLLPGRIKNKRF